MFCKTPFQKCRSVFDEKFSNSNIKHDAIYIPVKHDALTDIIYPFLSIQTRAILFGIHIPASQNPQDVPLH